MAKAKKKHLNAKEYDNIKLLLGVLNGNASKVAGLVDRSGYTVGIVKKSEDFADYCRINTARYEQYKATKTVKAVESPQPNTSVPSEDIALVISNINDTMLEIRDLFKWISENVEVKPKNRFKW